MKQLRFGIIGCGVISDWHAASIAELDNARLTSVFDVNWQRASDFGGKYQAKPYGTMSEFLQSEIDAVCVCTPSGLHAEYVIAAARAGKHIVVEKPMGITKEQLDEIERACGEHNVKLCAVSQLVFSDGVQQIRRVLQGGHLGKLILGNVTMKYYRSPEYYQTGGWRGTWSMDGGGALMNQGIHGIGLLQYLMGPVRSVSALARTMVHEIEVEDTATAILEFQNGAIGYLAGTTSIVPAQPRILEIHGEKGSVAMTEDRITRWEVPGIPKPAETGGESDTAANPTAFSVENHKRQLADFIDAVWSDRPPLLDEKAGRAPVDLILAIYQSSKTGRPVQIG